MIEFLNIFHIAQGLAPSTVLLLFGWRGDADKYFS